MLLAAVLPRIIRIGRLTVIDAAGNTHLFEGAPGPAATVRLHDPKLHWKLLLNPRLLLPEAYMDGRLTIEAFGRGVPALAAATRVWRDFFPDEEEVYRSGFAHMSRGWADAGG